MPARPLPPAHSAARIAAADCRSGLMSRREFLTRATALGLPVAASYGLLGLLAPPACAESAAPRPGGAVRVQMELKPLRDPRLADWTQIANFTRGWLEYLARYNADGTITGQLLTDWQVSEDARHYRLHLRPGVHWSNGDALTATDLLWNLTRWCDSAEPGNSMAVRMAALIDPATGQLAAGAAAVVDDLTLDLALLRPDATLIASCTDYPAAILHPGYGGGDLLADPIGTGPYFPEHYSPGAQAALVRRDDHWWNRGNGAWLERIDYADYGTNPSATLAAARAGAIDMIWHSGGDFIAAFDDLGWTRTEVQSAATLAVRFNQRDPVYADLQVRRALSLAVDNQVVLELGQNGRGLSGQNDHVCPLHPDHAELPPVTPDHRLARALIIAAGRLGHEFELVSTDDDWQAATCDAIAAQCRDAGIRVGRRRIPAQSFSADWQSHGWSATEWGMRPLGIQVLALAYRSGSPWNESGFADPDFDALVDAALSIPDAQARQGTMAQLQTIMRTQAVLIQPYWRHLCSHHAPQLRGADLHPMQEHRHTEWWIAAAAAD